MASGAILVALGLLATVKAASASPDGDRFPPGTKSHGEGLRAADYDAHTFVPPTIRAGKAWTPTARIEVSYSGFPTEAQEAFAYAIRIWEEHIESAVTIRVSAQFQALEEGILGSAGPHLLANFGSASALSDTWYPTALAEAMATRPISSTNADISASFNSDFPNWYFGTDGRTPRGEYDFVSVVLHELGHGLGFTGSFSVEDADVEEAECGGSNVGDGCWGIATSSGRDNFPLIFDRFVEDIGAVPLLNTGVYPNPSAVLGQVLQSGNVFFDGETVRSVHGDVPVNLFAPDNFEPGSSFSHLDEIAFPPGSINSLMTPYLGRAEAIHTPGEVTCAAFRDMGWPMGPGCHALFFAGLADAVASLSGSTITVSWLVAPSAGLERVDVQVRRPGGEFETVERVAIDPGVLVTQSFEIEIPDLQPGRHEIRLSLVQTDGTTAPGPEFTVTVPLNEPYLVIGPYPTPVSRQTGEMVELRVIVRQEQAVRVDAFDALGRHVARLHHGVLSANEEFRVPLDHQRWTAGIYFLRVVGSQFSTVRRLALIP